MLVQELWVNRKDFNDCKIVSSEIKALAQGEVLLEIDKFAMTSNNVTYAVVGDLIGYWHRFLAENGWGIISV